jgi:membrane protease YdiL (CAAX protease family)
LRNELLRALLGESSGRAALTGARARREGVTTVALVGALLAYANGSAWLATRREQELSTGINFAHLAMLGLTVAWAAAERLPPRELGLGRRALGRSLGWGLLVGALGSLPIRLFFAFPLVSRQGVTQPEFQGLSRGRLLWLVGGQFLLGSALFEEVAFRSLLHAKLVRLLGAGPALLAGSGVFAAWHLVITWHNLRRSNLPRGLFPFLYSGALAALFGGGLLFGLLRQATGHVAGSVLAHWLMVANIVLAVARPRRAGRP